MALGLPDGGKFQPTVLELPWGAVAREFWARESRNVTGRPVVGGGRRRRLAATLSLCQRLSFVMFSVPPLVATSKMAWQYSSGSVPL